MIKLDGKLLFEQWCKVRGVLAPCLFCELPEEQVLAWNALALWLCRHEWQSVDFAWQKVLKEQAEETAQAHYSETERIMKEERVKTHFGTCALRHGGIACTC